MIEVLKQLQEKKDSLTYKQKVLFALGISFFLVYMASVIAVLILKEPDSRSTAQGTQSSRSQASSRVLSVGDEGRLHAGNLSTVTIAVDEDAYSELDDVFIAKDEHGYQQLQLRGKIFSVENDTRVLVLENRFAKVRVRFLDGTKKGRDGWIPREWLK